MSEPIYEALVEEHKARGLETPEEIAAHERWRIPEELAHHHAYRAWRETVVATTERVH